MFKQFCVGIGFLFVGSSAAFSAPLLDRIDDGTFHYFDQKDRVKSASSLCEELANNYSLWELKKKLIGLDSVEHCKKLVEGEKNFSDPKDINLLERAKAQLSFFDRMTKFLAAFQDSHLYLGLTQPRAAIFLPLQFRRVEGKYLVAAKSQKLLDLAAQMSASDTLRDIAIGDELIDFNGSPVKNEIDALIPYQSDGNLLGREAAALDALSFRNYAYPADPKVTLKLKGADGKIRTFALVWAYFRAGRGDEAFYLSSQKFRDLEQLSLVYSPEKREWTRSVDFIPDYNFTFDVKKKLIGGLEFSDDKGKPILRKGVYVTKGRAYAVIQLLSFFAEKVKLGDETEMKSFLDVVRSAIQEYKDKELPLILDLRVNLGGNGDYSAKILSMIAPKDAVYAGASKAYRVTPYVRSLKDADVSYFSKSLGYDGLNLEATEQIQNLLTGAIKKRASYTEAFSLGDIRHDPEVGGFEHPIVALISPMCVSACDMMAMLLQSSQRARLIGTNTSGTGAGYASEGNLHEKWSDSLKIFHIAIPNFLFGKVGGKPGERLFPEKAEELCSENRPTVADVPYDTTLEDLKNGYQGWLNKAVEVLDKK